MSKDVSTKAASRDHYAESKSDNAVKDAEDELQRQRATTRRLQQTTRIFRANERGGLNSPSVDQPIHNQQIWPVNSALS